MVFISKNQNKIAKLISTQNNVEALSIVDHQLISIDNNNNTAEIMDDNGKKIDYVKIPTQVFNIEMIKK